MIYKETITLDSNSSILLEVLDGRSVRLTVKAQSVGVSYNPKNQIEGIAINGSPFVALGALNKVYVKINQHVQIYEVEHIIHVKDNVFQLNTHKRTKTCYFVVPMVFKKKDDVRWNQYFVNSYIVDVDEFPKLGLLYRFFQTDDYKQFEAEMKKHPMFDRIVETDLQHSMFVFRFPEKAILDVEHFLEGRYSEITENTKQNILNFNVINKDSGIGSILYKSEQRRKQLELNLGAELKPELELYDKPVVEEECVVLS